MACLMGCLASNTHHHILIYYVGEVSGDGRKLPYSKFSSLGITVCGLPDGVPKKPNIPPPFPLPFDGNELDCGQFSVWPKQFITSAN